MVIGVVYNETFGRGCAVQSVVGAKKRERWVASCCQKLLRAEGRREMQSIVCAQRVSL
jgi:hypothetical protein